MRFRAGIIDIAFKYRQQDESFGMVLEHAIEIEEFVYDIRG